MGAGAVALPEGFTLDAPSSGGLPAGFTLDQPAEQQSAYPAAIDYNPAVAMGEATAALGSGMIAAPLGGIAGAARSLLPGPTGAGADLSQRVSQALTYSPRTAGGQAITGAVAAPFELLAKGADAAGGAVTDAASKVLPAERTSPLHALVPTAPEVGTAVNTVIQAAPMAVGKVRPSQPVLNPNLQRANSAGFKVTPQEAGADVVSKTAASLSGEPSLARKISRANESLSNELIAGDFNLPKGTKVTRDVLDEIRAKNSPVYDEIRKAGTVEIDQAFMTDLGKIVRERQGASKDFAQKGGNPVMDVYESLTKNADGSVKRSFDASSAVDKINLLRKDGKEAFRKGETQSGKANMDAAKALEDILDRHLQKNGKMDAVEGMREARRLIAKTYEAERAMGAEGSINPQAYAKMLNKGVPLSGGAKVVGEVARDFPRSMQKPSGQATGPTVVDGFLALLNKAKGDLSGADVSLLFARPAARSAIASSPYQSLIVQRGLQSALASDAAGQALPLGAYSGLAGSMTLDEMKKRATE